MSLRALKYSMVFSVPLSFVLAVYLQGWWLYLPIGYAFLLVPLLDFLWAPDSSNMDKKIAELALHTPMYTWLLRFVLIAVYGCVCLAVLLLLNSNLETYELIGMILSLGLVLGGVGINVAHELGHRPNKFDQTLSKLLLLPSIYMHFFVEHNQGHHKNVGTEGDAATARRNEWLYQFWLRSVVTGYISAWQIENKRCQRKFGTAFTTKNQLIQFTLVEVVYFGAIALLFGIQIMVIMVLSGIVGLLLLETVNYIEHYGLERKKVNEHRYEKVEPHHSWNSNHLVGRLLLFELSRHSDHHYQPTKPYQVLNHHDQSPQLPAGYPGMMLLSLFPPIWFSVMNRRIPNQD